MEAPQTPKPDCLHPTPGLTPPTANQYAGIAYITLAGLVNTMVPVTGPWALHPSYDGFYPPPNRASWQPRPTDPLLGCGILILCLLKYCYSFCFHSLMAENACQEAFCCVIIKFND
ncbi:hypothetical protein DSO57_1004397 [Entomophthora muscae]|uniref:Uncharacterized protein n=1 Tax=Entomophthora muscae TaxID=34485 RepID=A0ACC2SX82_9FUNG|nr:hypothetical protein DSO57_1004397 [Entomophthora muscae]